MIATEINSDNFNDTVQKTLNKRDVGYNTYYLDSHELDGGEYWTVSQDENILGCWDDFQSACSKFHAIGFISAAEEYIKNN